MVFIILVVSIIVMISKTKINYSVKPLTKQNQNSNNSDLKIITLAKRIRLLTPILKLKQFVSSPHLPVLLLETFFLRLSSNVMAVFV